MVARIVLHTLARESMRSDVAQVDSNSVDLTDVTARVGVLENRQALLGYLIGANFNSTADQAIAGLPARYRLTEILVTNASVSLTTAAGGVYSGAGKTGTVVVAAAHVYTALTGAAKFLELTLEAIAGTDVFTVTTLYLSLTTPQGAAAIADVYLFGQVLPTS
jgi:hypothetical protein